MIALYLILTVGTGFLITVSRAMNSALGQRIGPMAGSLVNHLVGAIGGGLLLLIGVRTGAWHTDLPWYYYLGGCCGVLLVAAGNYALPRLGNVTLTILLTAAQLTATLWMDHTGWLGGRVIPFRWTTLIGMTLLLIGALLTQPPPPKSPHP